MQTAKCPRCGVLSHHQGALGWLTGWWCPLERRTWRSFEQPGSGYTAVDLYSQARAA